MRTRDAVFGIDVGTSSSKAVIVALDGSVLATAKLDHEVSWTADGRVEMDPTVWWDEFTSLSHQLVTERPDARIIAVGVSGMGPCVALTDDAGNPVRAAILYGVDTRAVEQIARLTAELGADAIVDRCGSALSTQSAGPKIAWVSEHEPAAYARTTRLFMPASYLGFKLTDVYYLDHHSASQCTPLYDSLAHEWYQPWWSLIARGIVAPPLLWPGDIAGTISPRAAALTGLPAGIPVIAGTIDAWTEAVSVGAHEVGDLMLMYGTTMFLINTVSARVTSHDLWGTVGAFPETYNLAAGMATSGAITGWLRGLVGSPDFSTLIAEAEVSGAGARGILMLPYFAGERTPIADPLARGTIAGLRIDHTRGDLYRAALEATAFGVRHNVDAFIAEGGSIERIVAVGGGTQGGLWTQIVSDVTGLSQVIPSVTIGASFGAAFLAASAVASTSIAEWNPPEKLVRPTPAATLRYAQLFELYRELYPATSAITHRLANLAREF